MVTTPPGIDIRTSNIILKPHQDEAVRFLRKKDRAILADRRGVGKTYPALIAMRESTRFSEPTKTPRFLYVCPSYQMPQNQRKIQDIYPNDSVRIIARGDSQVPEAIWNIVSYHTLTTAGIKATPWLLKTQFDGVIFDEGHRLRRRQNQWTKTASRLAKKTPRVYLLTGTPQVKDPGDYWAQLNILAPRDFPGYWDFVNRWCRTWQSPWKVEILGLRQGSHEEFAQMLSKYLLRRDISLPDPTEHDTPVQIEKALLAEHKKAKKQWIIEYPDEDDPQVILSGGALVIKLRRLVAHSEEKLKVVEAILEDMPNEQAIVFTWFRDSASRVAEFLGKSGRRKIVEVSGNIPALERARIIEQEWKPDKEAVLVATIPSIQEGLDLQNAATAIFFEVPYVWSDTDQAIGRIHREGQKRQVNVHFVRASGTVDDAVFRAMMRRRNEAATIESVMADILNDLRASAI